MSGGRFNYQQYYIGNIADYIQEEIDNNNEPWFPKDTPYSWEQRINSEFTGARYSDETIAEFKNAVKYLSIAKEKGYSKESIDTICRDLHLLRFLI